MEIVPIATKRDVPCCGLFMTLYMQENIYLFSELSLDSESLRIDVEEMELCFKHRAHVESSY